MIVSASRQFTEGHSINDCMLKACEIICPENKKLFECMSLSAKTVASTIAESVTNVQHQLIAAAKDFVAYCNGLEEFTGATDTEYCAVFIRGVNNNMIIVEELLDLVSIKGTTTGRDVFRKLEACIERCGLSVEKLVSMATDGAPAMCL